MKFLTARKNNCLIPLETLPTRKNASTNVQLRSNKSPTNYFATCDWSGRDQITGETPLSSWLQQL